MVPDGHSASSEQVIQISTGEAWASGATSPERPTSVGSEANASVGMSADVATSSREALASTAESLEEPPSGIGMQGPS
jgi:hypothetical protein